MHRHRIVSLVLIGLLLVSLLALVACASTDGESTNGGGSTGSGSSSGLTPSDDPEIDKGRELVEVKCDMCHTLDRIVSADKTAEQWEETVARMREKGAVLTDQEAKQIVDYLASQ